MLKKLLPILIVSALSSCAATRPPMTAYQVGPEALIGPEKDYAFQDAVDKFQCIPNGEFFRYLEWSRKFRIGSGN